MRKEKERKSRGKETEEERRIRKEKEKLNSSKQKETEEERRIRKEKEKQKGSEKEKEKSSGGKREETEEERRIRKEKEKSSGGKREETEEERKDRKNRERGETEEERRKRKEREKAEKENKEGHRRKETEEERRIRKEKEKSREGGKETEEQRAARKERERKEKERNVEKQKEIEEETAARKEKEKRKYEEERKERKERERRERENAIKQEETLKEECLANGTIEQEDYENEKGSDDETEEEITMQPVESDDNDTKEGIKMEPVEYSDDNDTKEGITMQTIESDDDDVPLARRKKPAVKRKVESGDESDDEPLSMKKDKMKKSIKQEPVYDEYDDDEGDYQRPSKKMKKPAAKKIKTEPKNEDGEPVKKMTKKEKELEEEKKVWKWWEEESKLPEGVKWKFLEHKGPVFAKAYEPLPPEVRFWYDGKVLKLTEETEEVATFYGKMLDHDYTTKEVFNKNFFKDWRKMMTPEEKAIIRDLSKCDFSEIDAHFKKLSQERKDRSKEEKNKEKEENAKVIEEYGFCMMDGHRERIGNFRTEPPGLFRGRGEHPKQGSIKTRIQAEDVIINCSKDAKVPEPPAGHKWKKVQHDNTVTWLATWTDNVQGQIKYIMLNPSSRLKGEKDWQKYEKARELKGCIDKIREDYMLDMKSKEMRIRQRAVALYFIDKLALRAGNEKDGDEQADTVGCCSLRVEHIELHELKDGKENVVEFDFLGKDSIRYQNDVAVDKKVFKNVKLFMENKKDGDDLFDRLNTASLNQYLNTLMDGLTAKVFRTFNASFTLQNQLDELTVHGDNVAAKMLSYNRANRAVAVLCNHQRAVPKSHETSMANLDGKLEDKQKNIKIAEKNLKHAKKAYKKNKGQAERAAVDKCKKALERFLEQLEKLEIQKTDKDENKTIALGTSKLNYLDPRISVQWCKTHEVPVDKVYNKTQREKFRWAIDMIMNSDDVYHF